MKYISLFLLLIVFYSCETLCTDDLEIYTVSVVDTNGQKVVLTDYYSIKLSNNDTLYRGVNMDTLPTFSSYQLVNDSENLSGTEVIRFHGYIDSNLVAQRDYSFKETECSIERVAGDQTIVVSQ